MARVPNAITPYTYKQITYQGERYTVLDRESFSRHYIKRHRDGALLSLPDVVVGWIIDGHPHAKECGCKPCYEPAHLHGYKTA